MNKRRSLFGVGLAGILGILALVMPHQAHAQGGLLPTLFSISDISFTAVQWLGYGIAYILVVTSQVVFVILTFLVQFVLDLNFTIVNSTSVQFGFSIVLAFANLLFVAAVIIMAVATIVRYEAYGAKQMLFRIIIAAIGVNFSLILAGTVINFADQGTKFFMDGAIPTSGGSSGAVEYLSKTHQFTSHLAGAFNPQQIMTGAGIDPNKDTPGQIGDIIKQSAGNAGGGLAIISGIFLSATMMILMTIFMAALLAAFLWRYITLTLLLIIMPAVWLAWIFPFGKGLVGWWRNLFVKASFFAPMAMFFLYLSMRMVDFLHSTHQIGGVNLDTSIGDQLAAPGGVGGFIQGSVGGLLSPIVKQAVNFILVAGTLYGGLYFSSKLGIKAAGAGAKAFESLGNTVKRNTIGRAQKAVTTGAKNTATRTLDRIRTAGKNDKGESWLQQTGSALSQRRGLGGIGRAMASAGVADKATVEARVKDKKESYKNMTNDALESELRRMATGSKHANVDAEAAIFDLLKERKALGGLASRVSPSVQRDLDAWEAQYKKDNEGRSPSKALKAAKVQELKTVTHRAEDEAFQAKLGAQLERAKNSGAIKDIVAAAPRVAAIAPKAKTKDKTRDLTDLEAVAQAVGSVKVDEEAVAAALANDAALFDSKQSDADPAEKDKLIQQAILATLELKGGHVKKIADINAETTAKVLATYKKIGDILDDPKSEAFKEYFYDTEDKAWKDDVHWDDLDDKAKSELTKNKVSLTVARAKLRGLKGAFKNVNLLGSDEEERGSRSAHPRIEVVGGDVGRRKTEPTIIT